MAKGKKSGGKNFQPGMSGNPSGRPPLSEEQRALKAMTREQYQEVATLLLTKTQEELMLILDSPGTPALMSWIIKVILVSSEKGDYAPLDSLLNRLIGKVTDKVETTNTHEIAVKGLTTPELIEQAKVALGVLSAKPLAGSTE